MRTHAPQGRVAPLAATGESLCTAAKTQCSQNRKSFTIDEPKGTLQFCYSVFGFFETFLDFPSLCLRYLLVIVLCPLFPLVNMMLALSLETVVFLPS